MAKSNALGFLATMFLAASAVIVPKPSIAETDEGNFLVLPGEICMASNGAPFLLEVKKEVGTGRIALRLANSENWSAASSAAHQVMSEDHLYVFRGRSDFVFTRLDLDGQVEMGGCRSIDLIYRELEARAIIEATASMEATFAEVLDEKKTLKEKLDSVQSANSTLEQNTSLLESRLSEASSELSALKLLAESLRIQAEEKSEEVERLKAEVTRLQAQLAAALAARKQAEVELEGASFEIDALRAANAQLMQETQESPEVGTLSQQVEQLGSDLNTALARSAQLARLLTEQQNRAELAEALAATEAEARRLEGEAVTCLLQAAEESRTPDIEFLRQQLEDCRAGVVPVTLPEPKLRPSLEELEVPEPKVLPDLKELEAALSDALSEETTETDNTGRNALMALSTAELESFRREVSECWMIGPGSAESRVSLVVSFDMTPEGKPIADSIFLVSFDGVDIQAVERAYQSARRAILRCGVKGYTLPATKYESWKTVELSFVPF